MEKLDRNLQRRVWARVYDKQGMPLNQKQRETLRKCLERSRKNLAVYEKMKSHGIYGDAFTRLYKETAEQMKMLGQMLQ